MKKIIFTAMLALAGPSAIFAQQHKIEYSTPFDEPESGWNKVMQLKNGNTFFFHFTKKKGIEVIVYDKNRKVMSEQVITSNNWEPKKMSSSMIEGLYELGGQPVIFLHQLLDRTPTLFRIRLDGNTGAVVEENAISTLPRYKAGAAWAMAYGGVEAMDFYIEKDPQSDNYAVVNFNSFAHESSERVEVIHYGAEAGNHKVLNRAFYDAQGFKYLGYIGMTVDGAKRVFMCTYGYNTNNSGGKDSRVIISRLGKGEKEFTHKKLEFTDDFKDTKAVMEYNPGTNLIQLLTLTYTSSKNKFFSNKTTSYYMTLMSFIDPESLYIVTTKPLMNEKVTSYARGHFSTDDYYSGLPQQMVINNDHSTTVLFEESQKEITKNANTGQIVSARTFLGNIGISELDNKGSEQDGYAINKVQQANGIIDPLYVSHKSKGHWSYRGGGNPMVLNNNAFMSFDYVNANTNKYVVFNDYTENFHKGEDAKRKKVVVAISDANTVCYKLNNGKIDKYFLFGAPKEDNEAKFCYIESSHFMKDNNTYATLMMDRKGRKKQAQIAWVKFN
ncbi:MAG: hypothetical protein K0R82_438 [Flavipsychrobacter sp.]|jgi:hypothetical protein|nr:hypothetical protein [Flavipsychrobacter sp.]